MNLTPEEKHKAIIFFGLLKQLKADAKGRKVNIKMELLRNAWQKAITEGVLENGR